MFYRNCVESICNKISIILKFFFTYITHILSPKKSIDFKNIIFWLFFGFLSKSIMYFNSSSQYNIVRVYGNVYVKKTLFCNSIWTSILFLNTTNLFTYTQYLKWTFFKVEINVFPLEFIRFLHWNWTITKKHTKKRRQDKIENWNKWKIDLILKLSIQLKCCGHK